MNDDEVRRLESQLRALRNRQRREVSTVDGVTPTAVRVLGVIARGGDAGVSPGHISAELSMKTSNVASALRELDDADLVERQRADNDRRQIRVRLTRHGVAAVAKHRSMRAGWLHEAVSATLSPGEQRTLLAAGDLLERLAGYRTPADDDGGSAMPR